jgi:glutamine amidotransferase-like uncharacterized protein
MVIKYKHKRRLVIRILGVLVAILLISSMIGAMKNEMNILTFISFLFQIVYWYGLYYFEAARYDDKKIIAQYGWPRINYGDIVSVKSKWGDIVISSEKHEITINKEVVDQQSLEKFITYLDKKTTKPLDTSILV